MTRIIRMTVCMLMLAALLLCPAHAEETELYLMSTYFQNAEYIGTDVYEEGYTETFLYYDGLIAIELMSVAVSPEAGYPAVGEVGFSDLLDLRYANVTLIEEIECEPVSGYPTQRLHLEAGSDEDECIVDAIAVWTEAQTFVLIMQTDADAYYGYVDGYEAGETQLAVDEWFASLEIWSAENVGENAYTLVADFACGDPELNIAYYEFTSYEPFSIDVLAQGLTELTGLDFIATGYIENGEVFVDWQLESTLIAGLDDREQYEGFAFFDVDPLNWFMLDSMYATIYENTGLETVYYTMNGGEALYLPDMSLMQEFPSDVPYMGSPFYYAHYDVQG